MQKKYGIIFITGFLQDYAKPTGLETQQRILEARYKCRDDVEVYEPLTWHENMKKAAAMLKRDGCAEVIIAGYSYGGGHGAQKLSQELARLGIVVHQVLCDPVARPKLFGLIPIPTFGLVAPPHPRSLTGAAKVKVPKSVASVVGLRQDNNRPAAHPIKWRRHTWTLPLVDRPDVIHANIDESPEWHDLLIATIENKLAA